MEKVKVTIDGKTIEVDKNTTVLEAAKKLNILIPTFCYNEKLPIFGGCRMCLVWDKKWKRSIIACGTYVYDGMEIETLNENVFNDRKFILEMLFTRHPLDCPVCDKAGECDLQNWGTYYGPQHNVLPISAYEKIRPEEDWESDYLEFVSNRCVLCLKCISVCQNVNGSDTLFQEERGFEILIAPDKKPMDSESSCEMCGLCVDVCPVGAILFKPFKYNARPWLLKERVTYCGFCSMNCPVAIDYDDKTQKIYRIRSTADLQVCAGAYLGYDSYENERLEGAYVGDKKVSFEEAINKVAEIINENPQETVVISSAYSFNEVFEALNKLKEKTNVRLSSVLTTDFIPTLKGFEEETGAKYKLPTFKEITASEKVVIIGEDVSAITPVLSYFFNAQYKEGNKISDRKKVIYIGDSLKNSSKFFPEVIETDDILNINLDIFDDKTAVVYCPVSLKGKKAYDFGKLLGKISKKGAKVVILPYQTNAVGQVNTLDINYYLPDIISDDKVKNVVIFEEDLLDYFDDGLIESLKGKNVVYIGSFKGKLSEIADFKIGINLWLEDKGTVEGFFGKRQIKGALKGKVSALEILSKLVEKVKYTPSAVREEFSLEIGDFEGFKDTDIQIYDFSFFSKRSKNLQNWKIKKSGVEA